MMSSRRRRWSRLGLGLVVVVLLGALPLLSHLWTSVPDGYKKMLRQDNHNLEAVPRMDRGHDSEDATVSMLYDENAVPQDNRNIVPSGDDRPNAGPRDKVRNRQANNQPDEGVVHPLDNRIRVPDGKELDSKEPEAVVSNKHKNKIVPFDKTKPTKRQDKILPDRVPNDANEPDEFLLHEKRRDSKSQYKSSSFHRKTGVNANVNNIPELRPDISAKEFIDTRQEKEIEDESRLPTLPRNKIETIDSSAGVGSFQNQARVPLGVDINGTGTLPESEGVHEMLEENNFRHPVNNLITYTKKHRLLPPSTSEKTTNLGNTPNQDLSNQVLDESKLFQNSAFQFQKSTDLKGRKFDEDSFFNGVKNDMSKNEMNRNDMNRNEMNRNDMNRNEMNRNDMNRNEVNRNEVNRNEMHRNEMNRNDFAADANQNANFQLPIKSKLSETDDNSNEFDSGIKFVRKNHSNIPGSVDIGGGVRVVSMSLYGSEPRYTEGAIKNARLVKENFPGWTLRIYIESPASSASRFGLVPRNIVENLRRLGVDIHHVVPEQDSIPPMMWRFLVADDLSVDYFIIRDSDSRLTERDAAAVSAWIRSGKPFHSIRDHPSHANYAVSGGLWGGRTKELRDILRRSWIDIMRGSRSNYFEDMNFLNGVVWPHVKDRAYCSDSVSCDRWPNSHPFPVVRYGYDHVGQVFNEHDLGRPIDIRILKAAGENPRCMPTEDGS